jgi:hypothetical protein
VKFSEQEVRFLMNPHTVEHAMGTRSLRATLDLRELGCPPNVFESLLERRAKALGTKWIEFRAQNHSAVVPAISLESEIAILKPF